MHTIRLRRPWTRQFANAAVDRRVDVPDQATSVESPPAGMMIYRRNFNRPSGLDEGQEVQLVVTGWTGLLRLITVNGVAIDAALADPPLRADIAAMLQGSNIIQVDLGPDEGGAVGLTGHVRLEIREASGESTATKVRGLV